MADDPLFSRADAAVDTSYSLRVESAALRDKMAASRESLREQVAKSATNRERIWPKDNGGASILVMTR